VLSLLTWLSVAVTFGFVAWARHKFKGTGARVLFFFAAWITGNVVYFVLGVIWAWATPDRSIAISHAVGAHLGQVVGSTIVAAFVGAFLPLIERIRTAGKSN
jgi:hypothetical protein